MTLDEFFKLSWYEWSLQVHKVNVRKRNERDKWEGQAVLFRELMALMVNTNPYRRKGSKQLTGKDFIKLSFDEQSEEKGQIISPKEVDEKLSKLMKNWNKDGK